MPTVRVTLMIIIMVTIITITRTIMITGVTNTAIVMRTIAHRQ
jgi:hypothetical protein